jgi:hypothetical protein
MSLVRSADGHSGFWHDVAMTDGPEVPELNEMNKTAPFTEFEVRWPSSAERDPKVATRFGLLADGSGGWVLFIGHVTPPPWFTPSDRQRGREEVGLTLEVELGGVFYMTEAAMLELYNMLRRHLHKES